MGGLPAESWAYAVNRVYEAGIVVAAASGDNIVAPFGPFPFYDTVWPSRFNRVITVVGATYDKTPYITNVLGEIEGSWGPDKSVMKKAIAAYTPNVAWMKYRTNDQFAMDERGRRQARLRSQLLAHFGLSCTVGIIRQIGDAWRLAVERCS
jgi:hypothetical protein